MVVWHEFDGMGVKATDRCARQVGRRWSRRSRISRSRIARARCAQRVLFDRYYDPATDQFLSVDPDLAETGQPYVFTGDDPLNATDPLGLCAKGFGWFCSAYHHAVNAYHHLKRARNDLKRFLVIHPTLANVLGIDASQIANFKDPTESRSLADRAGIDILDNYVPNAARNSNGLIWSDPVDPGANTIRVMGPSTLYPNGEIRIQNQFGNYLDSSGKVSTDPSATHIPIPGDEDPLSPLGDGDG
jgi:hypothetical protein